MKKFIPIIVLIVLVIGVLMGGCFSPTSHMISSKSASISATSSSSKTIELRYASLYPPTDPAEYAPSQFIKNVERMSSGRIKITPYYSETLGKAPTFLDMLKKDVCDIAIVNAGLFPDVLKGSGILETPGIAPNMYVAGEIIYSLYNEGLLNKDFQGLKPLWWEPSPMVSLFFADKQVNSLAELKGMKIRTPGGPELQTIKALGATPVDMSISDTYLALYNKTIDGFITSVAPFQSLHLNKVSKYFLLGMPIGFGSNVILMTQQKWNDLPVDIQVIFQEAANEARYQYLDYFQQQFPDPAGIIRNAGVETYTLAPDEAANWNARMNAAANQWASDADAKGFPGNQILFAARKIAARYTNTE